MTIEKGSQAERTFQKKIGEVIRKGECLNAGDIFPHTRFYTYKDMEAVVTKGSIVLHNRTRVLNRTCFHGCAIMLFNAGRIYVYK